MERSRSRERSSRNCCASPSRPVPEEPPPSCSLPLPTHTPPRRQPESAGKPNQRPRAPVPGTLSTAAGLAGTAAGAGAFASSFWLAAGSPSANKGLTDDASEAGCANKGGNTHNGDPANRAQVPARNTQEVQKEATGEAIMKAISEASGAANRTLATLRPETALSHRKLTTLSLTRTGEA